MPDHPYIGKTLDEIANQSFVIANGFFGVSIFVKKDAHDGRPGKKLTEDFNLRSILRKRPELKQAKVVDYNTYCNQSVFRIIMP